MKKICLVLFIFIFAGFLPGCTEQQIAPEPKCLAGISIDMAMKSSERVLVGMNFVIDKDDPNLSLITTRPLSGAQFFEVWRKDSVGGYNTAMASCHSIRRIVELGFTNNSGQGGVCITCTVQVERLSIPEKDIDSAGRAYSMFSKSSDNDQQTLSLNPEQQRKMDWIDIGRDNQLETVILNKIDRQIAKTLMKGEKK